MPDFDNMLTCSYGGIEFDVFTFADSEGRDLARYPYPHRLGVAVRDQGGQGRTTRVSGIFMRRMRDNDGQLIRNANNQLNEDWLQRYELFVSLKDDGLPQTFVHPITGSYDALIGSFDSRMEPETWNAILVDIEFVEASEEPAILELGAASPSQSATEEVSAKSAATDSALSDAGLSSTTPAATTAAVNTWPDKSYREIQLELVELTNNLDTMTSDLELATDIDKYPAMIAVNNLRYSLQRAADAIAQVDARLMEHTVKATAPLLVLAARLYGAEQAAERQDEILQLNTVKNPARVEAGTVLTLQTPNTDEGRE